MWSFHRLVPKNKYKRLFVSQLLLWRASLPQKQWLRSSHLTDTALQLPPLHIINITFNKSTNTSEHTIHTKHIHSKTHNCPYKLINECFESPMYSPKWTVLKSNNWNHNVLISSYKSLVWKWEIIWKVHQLHCSLMLPKRQ